MPQPTRPVGRTAAGRDTARKDSTRKDSSRTRELIKWNEADSVANALLNKPGYDATRYQGVHVRFDARRRTLYLEGAPAGVGRGATLLVGDTIIYNDSTKLVVARGDTLILRDPSRGTADVVAKGELLYNVTERRGSLTNLSTALESGEKWLVSAKTAAFVSDSSRGGQTAFYARNGSITSCDDSIPDYHFQAKEIKMISKNIMIARPAVLYIGDVPVMWLPFIFQDMRSGRRSGILTPRFGVSEIFRNSPTYRRHLENLGYYFALNSYTDAQVTVDWRSGANSVAGDPGWVRLNGEWRYRWLDRFLTGRLAVSKLAQRDGTRNTAISWGHQQDFSQTTHLTTDINYVTNTVIQRQTTFDPRQVLATIQSQVNYQQKFGPASFSTGGSRRQYPGRDEVTQEFPNFSISTPTLSIAKWLDWTPSLDVHNTEQLKVNQTGEFAFRYFDNNGVRDSVQRKADARISSLSFQTPFKIFGFSLSSSIRASNTENNSPVTIAVIDRDDPTKKTDRVFGRTFSTEIDWQTYFSLPSVMQSTLKLTPSVSISNGEGSRGYWVRTEQTGGVYVHQSKRLNYSLSASPTFFGLFPGIGAITRFRHSISPQISFSYAPSSNVSREFLAATNRSPVDYIGSIAQNQVSLHLSQNLEAKLRGSDTSSTDEGRKLKLVTLDFSTLTYDFERKRKTGKSGFTTDFFRYDLASDLLPGFRFSSDYSLFQGSVLSDTAIFKPFRTGMSASFSLNSQSGVFAALSRIFGKAVPNGAPQIERVEASPDDALLARLASTPVAGTAVRNRQYAIPQTQGWQASFTFTQSRQRAPTGNGQIIEEDPRRLCTQYLSGPLYDQCIFTQQTNPIGATPIGRITAGGPFIRTPPREFVSSQMSFHLTPKWAAQWGTTYDFSAHQFASHSVTLQRELHDWRSIFGFTKGPNGNFAFNFFIALNAQPDIKFNYDKNTYRQSGQ